MTFYTKNDDGEYVDASQEIHNLVSSRQKRWVETETTKLREEVEKTVRDELTPAIEKEVETRVKNEFQPKLDEAIKSKETLEVQLRQKTIAAEYGFKPDTEKYLGTGSEDEMRKEADTLKSSFASSSKAPAKETSSGESPTQKRTGIKVTI